jgi:hypothetical protein
MQVYNEMFEESRNRDLSNLEHFRGKSGSSTTFSANVRNFKNAYSCGSSLRPHLVLLGVSVRFFVLSHANGVCCRKTVDAIKGCSRLQQDPDRKICALKLNSKCGMEPMFYPRSEMVYPRAIQCSDGSECCSPNNVFPQVPIPTKG